MSSQQVSYLNADGTTSTVTAANPLPTAVVASTPMITSQLPSTLGQKATTSSLSVTIASNQGQIGTLTTTTAFKVLSAATTNATLLRNAPSSVYGWSLSNTTASFKFLKFHNLNVAPTVGSSAVAYLVAIPPNSTVSFMTPDAITHSTGISYSITGASPDADTTAVAVGDVVGVIITA